MNREQMLKAYQKLSTTTKGAFAFHNAIITGISAKVFHGLQPECNHLVLTLNASVVKAYTKPRGMLSGLVRHECGETPYLQGMWLGVPIQIYTRKRTYRVHYESECRFFVQTKRSIAIAETRDAHRFAKRINASAGF